MGRRKRCPRCSFPVLRRRCLNNEYVCNWPDETKERPKLDPMPAGCIVRCGAGHPIRHPHKERRDKKGRIVEVIWRCKLCSTEAVVTARGADFREVSQREFIFERFGEDADLYREFLVPEGAA